VPPQHLRLPPPIAHGSHDEIRRARRAPDDRGGPRGHEARGMASVGRTRATTTPGSRAFRGTWPTAELLRSAGSSHGPVDDLEREAGDRLVWRRARPRASIAGARRPPPRASSGRRRPSASGQSGSLDGSRGLDAAAVRDLCVTSPLWCVGRPPSVRMCVLTDCRRMSDVEGRSRLIGHQGATEASRSHLP
jgi:hypothetical protein